MDHQPDILWSMQLGRFRMDRDPETYCHECGRDHVDCRCDDDEFYETEFRSMTEGEDG